MAKKAKRAKKVSQATDRYAARVERLRDVVREKEAHALLVVNDRDIRYLTGFHGEASWAVILGKSDKVYVLSDSRFEEEVSLQAPQTTPVIRKSTGTLWEEVAKIVKRHRIESMLFPSSHVTVAVRSSLAKAVGAKTLKPVGHLALDHRAVKDAEEVATLRKAVDIQEEAFKLTCEYIEPGMTEGEICGYLEMQMRRLGADGPAFETIVGAGPNASKPHYTPGRGKAKKNDIILIDWGACVDGYRSDMTRVVALGRMPKAIKEIYQVVLDAHLAAVDRIAPGVSLNDVDAAARDLIQRSGFGKRFRHGLGHGIGLDIHESPRLHAGSKGELRPGEVITIEPGIYLPGVGGVRLEDDVLVTETGHEVLCSLPKDLDSAVIPL